MRLQVAVVDDEEPVGKTLKRLLSCVNYDVETFPSGAEFLKSLSARRPDCLVLDLHLAGVDGFQVMAWLAESDPSLPVVIMTGHDSDETRKRALASPAPAPHVGLDNLNFSRYTGPSGRPEPDSPEPIAVGRHRPGAAVTFRGS